MLTQYHYNKVYCVIHSYTILYYTVLYAMLYYIVMHMWHGDVYTLAQGVVWIQISLFTQLAEFWAASFPG